MLVSFLGFLLVVVVECLFVVWIFFCNFVRFCLVLEFIVVVIFSVVLLVSCFFFFLFVINVWMIFVEFCFVYVGLVLLLLWILRVILFFWFILLCGFFGIVVLWFEGNVFGFRMVFFLFVILIGCCVEVLEYVNIFFVIICDIFF